MAFEAKMPAQSKTKNKVCLYSESPLSKAELAKALPDLWERAFDASPDLISLHDTSHRLIAVNKAMADIMGRTPEELKGCHCYDVVHGSTCPPLICPHKKLIDDGRPHQMEIFEESIDTWLLVTVNPLFDNDQQLIGSIHIARNINDQKLDQQSLRESEERLHHLSEATMEGVMLSHKSAIIVANEVLADMVGYSMEELKGMSLFKFIAPRQHERLINYLRTRQTGIYEFECVRKDGSRFPIQTHVRAVTYKNQLVYQTAIRDLTEQKKIEQERSTHERLQGVLQMAGAVCHEINQPMTAMYGYLDLMGGYLSKDHPLIEKIKKIEEQMSRIEKITRQLMNITKYKTKPYPGGEIIIDIDQSAIEKP